ncbi:MAG: membrane protein insertion efficiency factor YidD [Geminicoccales bacterium]
MEERSEGVKPRSVGVALLSLPIWAYRWLISPLIGPRCRYLPTCSDYALDALAQHGAIKGGWLTIRRVARCHPFGGHGFDPVPEKRERHREAG